MTVNPDKSFAELSGWSRRSSRRRGLVLITLTFALFAFFFNQIGFGEVISLLRDMPAANWWAAVLLTVSFPVLSAIRWRLILLMMGFNVPFRRCLEIIIGVWPISAVSPGKTGDLLKAVGLRRSIDPLLVAGSVLVERSIDVGLLAVFAFVGGLWFRDWFISGVALAVLLALAVAITVTRSNIHLPFLGRAEVKVKQLLVSMQSLNSKPLLFSLVIVLTGANWFASVVQATFLFNGVGATVPLGFVTAALPVAIFIGLLPVSFGGMGTRDGAIIVLFSGYVSSSQGLAVGLLYSFFGYWLLALVGLPLMKKGLDL